jgi:protein-disulfide isomerase
VLIGAAAALVAVGAAVGIAMAFSGGGSSSSAPTKLPGAAPAARVFAGVPQNGNILGSPAAPVTVLQYIDLQCPFCRAFEVESLPKLVRRYVRTGKVKIESRPILAIGPDSQLGQAAAIAAAKQNKMYDLMELVYFNQGTENTGWLNTDFVKAAGASVPGLDYSKYVSDLGSKQVGNATVSFNQLASADHVSRTPTFFVGRSGGQLRNADVVNALDPSPLFAAIRQALKA